MSHKPDDVAPTESVEAPSKPAATTRKTTKKKATTKKKTATRQSKKTAATPAPKLRVRQIRSTIRRQKTFQRTLEALGIHHHQDEVVVSDTPSTRGMLTKVKHLVRVTPEE